jgi:hypothetical protein
MPFVGARILKIDLRAGTSTRMDVSLQDQRAFLGAASLGAHLLNSGTPLEGGTHEGKAPLGVMTSPSTGIEGMALRRVVFHSRPVAPVLRAELELGGFLVPGLCAAGYNLTPTSSAPCQDCPPVAGNPRASCPAFSPPPKEAPTASNSQPPIRCRPAKDAGVPRPPPASSASRRRTATPGVVRPAERTAYRRRTRLRMSAPLSGGRMCRIIHLTRHAPLTPV